MRNMTMTIEGKHTLVIRVDLTQEHGPSGSGKTTIVASSDGNAVVPGHDGIKLGLNVYKKVRVNE